MQFREEEPVIVSQNPQQFQPSDLYTYEPPHDFGFLQSSQFSPPQPSFSNINNTFRTGAYNYHPLSRWQAPPKTMNTGTTQDTADFLVDGFDQNLMMPQIETGAAVNGGSPIVEEPESGLSSSTNLQILTPADYSLVPSGASKSDGSSGILTLLKKRPLKQKPKSAPKTRPAFVMKLWTMVNDPANQELINWNADGSSFIVSNRESFVQKILPKYFKHSNFASFVRQLNMYGWHKVQDASTGSLHSDERWQFINENFQRGQPDLLDKIVRNKPHDEQENGGTPITLSHQDASLLIAEVESLKKSQDKLTRDFNRIRQNNDVLWQRIFQSERDHEKRGQQIEKIMQFLASMYGNKVQLLDDGTVTDGNGQIQSYESPVYVDNLQPMDPATAGSSSSARPRLMITQRQPSISSSNSLNSFDIDQSPVQEILRTQSNALRYQQDLGNELNRAQEDELYTPSLPISTPDIDQFVNTPNMNSTAPVDFQTAHSNSSARLEEISRSLAQQEKSINEVIARLQQSSNVDQPSTFDLDEFLNDDLLPHDDGSKSPTPTTKLASAQNNHDDDLKREISDEEVEEIINPSKKRKSGNF